MHGLFLFLMVAQNHGGDSLRSSSSLPELELGVVHTEPESMADRAKTSGLYPNKDWTVCAKNVVVTAWKARVTSHPIVAWDDGVSRDIGRSMLKPGQSQAHQHGWLTYMKIGG